jgi:hypothetical protein
LYIFSSNFCCEHHFHCLDLFWYSGIVYFNLDFDFFASTVLLLHQLCINHAIILLKKTKTFFYGNSQHFHFAQICLIIGRLWKYENLSNHAARCNFVLLVKLHIFLNGNKLRFQVVLKRAGYSRGGATNLKTRRDVFRDRYRERVDSLTHGRQARLSVSHQSLTFYADDLVQLCSVSALAITLQMLHANKLELEG